MPPTTVKDASWHPAADNLETTVASYFETSGT